MAYQPIRVTPVPFGATFIQGASRRTRRIAAGYGSDTDSIGKLLSSCSRCQWAEPVTRFVTVCADVRRTVMLNLLRYRYIACASFVGCSRRNFAREQRQRSRQGSGSTDAIDHMPSWYVVCSLVCLVWAPNRAAVLYWLCLGSTARAI